ncbi:MAG: hypothetical protein M1837_002916 [Sclerophora amabilis]|nr:MAG: hypothetical protein M1837_002916 [Sclerophora amabilis]
MDATSAGKLTVFDPEKTKSCCLGSIATTGYSSTPEGQEGAQFFERNGDDLERCSVPGNVDKYLDVNNFVKCCGAEFENWAERKQRNCCGGKREKLRLEREKDQVVTTQTFSRTDICVALESNLEAAGGDGPWSRFHRLPNNQRLFEVPISGEYALIEPDVVLLDEVDCPEHEQSMFSGAWFWQGEKTALYTDGKEGEILGLKKPWDQELPPIKVPIYS